MRYNKDKAFREYRKQKVREYYACNQEEILEKVHKKRLIDKFYVSRISRNYYNAHWESVRAYQKKRYAKIRDKKYNVEYQRNKRLNEANKRKQQTIPIA